eukprot:CAMPEP_0119260582 /NCGR_PEP_ID=MMETSP1329-20130426/897_1 /TAXON_ID=114041 /ORGANISM="Genus nov. species nov., Strain RCC1024" /LENGTH=202 /DNA_ID=CAMNT_0007260007 /DNA_START=170 /DNA_END=775 /DNA_ORIENTATION=+
MGGLMSYFMRIDHSTPYGFKFSGITLWLLAADSAVQTVIDDFNPRTSWRAHSTLAYGMRLDEATARARFASLRSAVEGSGALSLGCAGAPVLWGDYPPYRMRVIGLALRGGREYDALRGAVNEHFGTYGSSFPHTSLVYDWLGSPRVTEELTAEIRRSAPALGAGAAVTFDAVALVDMRDKAVGEWRILDSISLVEEGANGQ